VYSLDGVQQKGLSATGFPTAAPMAPLPDPAMAVDSLEVSLSRVLTLSELHLSPTFTGNGWLQIVAD
jgi:hypothetical protein